MDLNIRHAALRTERAGRTRRVQDSRVRAVSLIDFGLGLPGIFECLPG